MASDAWASVRDFSFEQFTATANEIVERHAFEGIGGREAEDAIERLRRVLARTNLDRLPEAAALLSRAEILVIPDLLLCHEEDSIGEKGVALGLHVARSDVFERAWALAVTRGTTPALFELLKGYVFEEQLMQMLPSDPQYREDLRMYLSKDALAAGLLASFESSSVAELGEWVSGLGPPGDQIEDGCALWWELVMEFLHNGSADSLKAAAESLLAWVEPFGASVHESFSLHYLDTLRADRAWDERVVDWIIERLGQPDHSAPVGPWRRLEERSPGCAVALLNWIALRTLREFFASVSDPHGRFDFWESHFGDRIVGAEPLADGQAAILHLPPVVVVEFGDVGYAAYVYDESALSWLRSLRAKNPRSYQDRERLIHNTIDGTGLRITHPSGWQMDARKSIARALRGST